jgi:iron complex outermembrane receptor protein
MEKKMITENIWGLPEAIPPSKTESVLSKKPTSSCKLFKLASATILLLFGVFPDKNVQAGDNEVPLMDKVIVTASRLEEKIASVPANVTVISEQEIKNSPAETVPELLRSTPGIVVNDITGNGRNITVDLRGFGETASLNTLLLIDGRRINQADLSGVDWTLIPKDRIQQIEIIHGGRGSVLYGDNAAGGVINIITKKGEELLFSGGLVAGSYESLHSRLAVSGSTESLSYALSGNYRTSDGYRDNSGTDAKDVGLNLEYFASNRFNIALTGGYHEDDTSIPGTLFLSDLERGVSRSSSTTPDDFSDIKDAYIQIVPKVFFTETSYFKLETSTREKKNNAFSSFTSGTFDADTEIDTLIASPQIVFNEKIVNHATKLITGFDYNKSEENLNNQSIFFGSASDASFDLSKEDWGVYGHTEVAVTEKVIASGGYRYDHAKFESSTTGISDNVTMDENLYNGGLSYMFSDNSSVYINYAKSFRYPVLDEMFSFFTNSFDTNLGQQTTDDYEIGTRIQLLPSVNVGVNLFRLNTDNEIFFNPSSFANENFDNTTIRQGVELTVSKYFSKISLNGSYTFRDTEIDGGTFDGNEIPNVPRHQFTAGAEATIFENVQLNLTGSYIGERPFISDFANAVDYQDDYLVVNAKLTYSFKKLSTFIAVNNLLDEEYSEYGGVNFQGFPGIYPAPGINVFVGISFDI